jgi:formate hydrogenlyase transcriptional activator
MSSPADLHTDPGRRPGTAEYISVDSEFRIIAFSEGAHRFADDPSAVVPGNDLRFGFPEFVGAEKELLEVLHGQRLSWSLTAVSRSHGEGEHLFLDLSAEPSPKAGESTPTLIITLEDVSSWMGQIQARTQSANDASLLLHSLTASKDYIESILDAMAGLLVVTSADGIITSVNRTALRLTEYSTPELLGQPVTMLVPDIASNSLATAAPNSAGVELRCYTRSGAVIPMSFTQSRLAGNEQNPGGMVYFGRDLRERHEAEAYISKLESEKHSLQVVLTEQGDAGSVVWASHVMDELMKNLSKVAPTDTTVLVTGETGTGKEVVARAIHQASHRSGKLFVTVNCASLPEGLIETELFGHEKGAFTGAIQRHIGRFELADGGTVFLDEIGELPLTAQSRLLRVLQEQTFERVGGTQSVKVNVRVIAATNRNLAEEVRRGQFREDLLFRLNVFPLNVAPLRERKEDIIVLAEHFLKLFSRRTNKRVASISAEAQRNLLRYHWPGNVRELANIIERAMIVCEGNRLEASDLALVDIAQENTRAGDSFDDVARRHILDVLKECDGVIEASRGAASRLGIKPATLRSRMKKLGISRRSGSFVAAPMPPEL